MGLKSFFQWCTPSSWWSDGKAFELLPMTDKEPHGPFSARIITAGQKDLLTNIAGWYKPLYPYRERFSKTADEKSLSDLLARELSAKEQEVLLKIMDWQQSAAEYTNWLRDQPTDVVAKRASEYSIPVKAYTKFLKKEYPSHRPDVLTAAFASIDPATRVKLEQKHKTTGTLVESINQHGLIFS